MKTLTITRNVRSDRPPGLWGVVKTSYEVYGISRMTMNDSGDWQQLAVPDVWRHNPTELKFADGREKPQFTPMDEAFQHWLFRWNVEKYLRRRFASDEEYRIYWRTLGSNHQLVRWFTTLLDSKRVVTNKAGLDNCANFISGERLDGDLPKYSNVVTARWLAKVLALETRNIRQDGECISLEVINHSKGYLELNPYDHPHLFFEPVQSGRRKLADGTVDETLIEPFPQFEPTRPILPAILPFDHRTWMPVQFVRVLAANERTPGTYEFLGRNW
jgi:hypothetical protein